jgi:hypothetical protein
MLLPTADVYDCWKSEALQGSVAYLCSSHILGDAFLSFLGSNRKVPVSKPQDNPACAARRPCGDPAASVRLHKDQSQKPRTAPVLTKRRLNSCLGHISDKIGRQPHGRRGHRTGAVAFLSRKLLAWS